MSEEAIYKLHRHGDTLEEFEYVQELVRCKECKHWWSGMDYGDCDHFAMDTTADDFCSYGEREGE